MSCTIVKNTKIFGKLVKYYGKDESKALVALLSVVDGDNFSEHFMNFRKTKRKEELPSLSDANDRKTLNDIIAYNNLINPDGNDSVLAYEGEDNKMIGNYTSVQDRHFCQRIVANEVININTESKYDEHTKAKNNKVEYINQIRKNLGNYVMDRTCEVLNISQDEFLSHFDDDRCDALIDKYLNTKDVYDTEIDEETAEVLGIIQEYCNIAKELLGKNIYQQEQNLIATVEEIIDLTTPSTFDSTSTDTTTYAEKFFNVVFRDPRLFKFRDDIKDSTDDEAEHKAADGESVDLDETDDTEGKGTDNVETYDESFRVFDHHDGQYKTFMFHLGEDIKNYFNRLAKLKSPQYTETIDENGEKSYTYVYDTNNSIGIADTMSASECAMMMYTHADYSNVDAMIESVKRIAEQIPGFEGFIQFYNALSDNRDFANEVYCTFAKMIISKKETRVVNGKYICEITNEATNRFDALKFEYFNNLRSTAVPLDESVFEEELKEIKKQLSYMETYRDNGKLYKANGKIEKDIYNKDSLEYKADKMELCTKIANALKMYYPGINTSTILNYISSNTIDNKFDEFANFRSLIPIMENILKGVKTTKSAFSVRQYNAANAESNNRNRRKQKDYNPADIVDSRDIWIEGFLSKEAEAASIQLANALLKHAVVKTQLNSRNAAGKLSSDVINNSMISNLKSILESHLNTKDNQESPLRNFAAYKFRGKQYNFSNILLETVEDGVIINKGLFRQEGDKYVPTDYANELLKFHLFNGVQDTDSGNSVLYSGMSRGDYAATAMIHYFKGSASSDFADYFLRTPSDAPKNYIMRAPKYALDYKTNKKDANGNPIVISFWEIKDKETFDKRVEYLMENVPHYNKEYFGSSFTRDHSAKLNYDDISRLLLGETLGQINISDFGALVEDRNNKPKATLKIEIEDKGYPLSIIVTGNVTQVNNKKVLSDVTLSGVVNNLSNTFIYPDNFKNKFKTYVEQELIAGKQSLDNFGTKVVRNINRQHPIFRQMLRTATQEFQDMGVAIDKIFQHKNGRILMKDGKPILSEWLQNEKDIERVLCANYHHKKNTYVDSDGTKHEEKGLIQNIWTKVVTLRDAEGKEVEWHYEKSRFKTLSGNVFHSDRFTLNGKNYLDELIVDGIGEQNDGTFHILYGGIEGVDVNLRLDNNGNVIIDGSQKEAIEAKLEEFIKDYVNHTIEKVREFDNLLEDIPHTNDNIAEFILNYRLAYFNCNDLLEGDSKFYKSAQDFLKRAKEVQGSGVPYGIVDYTKPMFGQNKREITNALINSKEEQEFLSKLNDCKQYTTFRAVTIKNTIRRDKNTEGILVDNLTKRFVEEGLSPKEASEKAQKMMDRYANTKVNDAQSYITFEEWIRRISARGQYYKYKPLIERILDESQPISAEDIDEFIQVQKNFYYDQYYDEQLGTMRPRQIKNAEFVIVPRFVKGTQLEDVYNLMIEYGIDQLNTEETSKAGKVNILTLWDNEGNITEENLADFKNNVLRNNSIEMFDYNYLYTQQETPQHINDYNKAALQIMKKILDNIDATSPVGKHKKEFLELYAENIYDSFSTLMKELNVPIDKNGNIDIDEQGKINGLDYSVFLKRLEDEMVRLGLDSNMMDFVTMVAGTPEVKAGDSGFGLNTKMPAYLNSTKQKMESIAQAVINNKITRQKLPGFHAAQITNVGWKSKDDRQVIYSKELRYHPYGEPFIEVMLPAANFGLNRNDEKYKQIREDAAKAGKSNEEIEDEVSKAMLEELRTLGLDKVIGYRIPTEGKQSMAIMKVVGFTDDALGSTIVVPDAWVAQTGSDFDIDSVYGIQYATYQKEDGTIVKITYDENKGVKGNSREARMNRMLDNMFAILESDESLEENLSQSQFQDIINARDKLMSALLKQERENRSCFDFFDQAAYQEDAMSGAKLKARSVIRDTFCSVCNTMKPILTKGVDVIYKGDSKKFKELRERFDIKDDNGDWQGLVEDVGSGYIKVTHKMFGWSNDNHNVVNSLLTVYSSETTAHILDAIKEGAIPNVNDFTFDVYKLFPDLGSDYDTCVGFMMQPGVSAIVNAYNKNKSIYAKGYQKPVDSAIKSIASMLKVPTEDVPIEDIRKHLDERLEVAGINKDYVLDAEMLKARIDKGVYSEDENDLLWDYAVILQYEKLSEIASKINKIAGVCKPDKFGAKQTIFQTRQVFEDIADIINDEEPVFDVKNEKSFLERIYPGISKIAQSNGRFVDEYIKHPDNNSEYPSLHYFLKYASAVSIKVNQGLFITQHPNFIKQIERIEDVISGENPKITEETYNKFEKYFLADIYKSIDIIGKQVSYEYGKGIVQTNGNRFAETRRIFGYDKAPDLSVERTIQTSVDEENKPIYTKKVVQFETSDINHPEDGTSKDYDINVTTDIDAFAQLSPAQKVLWVQQHFKDSLICKHIKVNLVNNSKRGNEKYGAQTIEFIEDGQDIEYIYEEFRKTFMNKNPFLVLTAMDIIKYAFVVEGFQMRHTVVNKVIDNDVLVNSQGIYGTGVIEAIDKKIQNVVAYGNPWIDELLENFVRSHSNMKEISHTYINKKDRGRITAHQLGFCTIRINKDNNDFLVNHGFGYNVLEEKEGFVTDEETGETYSTGTYKVKRFEPNKYIKIKYNKKTEVLYKITKSKYSDVIYLSPLNLLQENENSTWSTNSANRTYRSPAFYESFVAEAEDTKLHYNVSEYATRLKKLAEEREDTKAPEIQKQKGQAVNIDFNIDDDTRSEIYNIKQAIVKHFNGINGSTLFIESPFLTDHVKEPDGMSKIVNGNEYLIHKIDTSKYEKYTKNINLLIKPEDEPMRNLIERIRDRGIGANKPGEAKLENIFAIDEVYNPDANTFASSIIDEIASIDEAIRKDARNSDNPEAEKYTKQMDDRDLDSTIESIAPKIEDVVISQTEALHAQVDKLFNGEHGFNFFEKSFEDGSYMSMTDPRVIDLIKKDPAARRQYLKNILQAYHLVNMYKGIQNTPLNKDTEKLKYYFDKIAEDIDKLEKADIIKQAESLFVTEYLTKLSKNPNIQRNLMGLMDGWFTTSGFSATFDDLQNVNDPLIQVITSDCMSDIRGKELQAEETVRKFKKGLQKIKDDAAAKGLTINMDNIIDEYGKFVTAYNNKFQEDLDALRTAKDEAEAAYRKSTGDHYEKAQLFEKLLKARLAYNKWKLKNTNQEVDDVYYYKYNNLVESMINPGTGKFYDVFVEYSMLTDELRQIMSHEGPDGLDAHWESEKNRVLTAMRALTSDYTIDGVGFEKLKEDLEEHEYSSDPRKRRLQIISNATSAQIIREYITERKQLENEYFDKKERFGFQEQLAKYLDVVRYYEESSIPPAEYQKIDKYIEAKTWIKRNAYKTFKTGIDPKELDTKDKVRHILEDHFDVPITEDNAQKLIAAAYTYFKYTVEERSNPKAVYKEVARSTDAYDENGVIDARKFSVKQLRAIKDSLERRYGIGEANPYSERSIIHVSSNDDVVYNSKFYGNLKPGGVDNVKYLAIVKKINDVLKNALDRNTGKLRIADNLNEDELNIVLDAMKELGYDTHEQTFSTSSGVKKHLGVKRRRVLKIQEFIKNNVDFELSEEDRKDFELERAAAELIGGSYYQTWCKMNYEWNEERGTFVPNHLFWGHAKPKPEVADEYIDKQKTVALRVLNKIYTERPTKYYYQERDRIFNEFGENSQEYKDWVELNHIYNPHKHRMEPLICWTVSEPNEYFPGEWEPTFRQKERTINEDYVNDLHKPKLGVAANFKTKEDRELLKSKYDDGFGVPQELLDAIMPDTKYDQSYSLNEGEEAMKLYLQQTLASLATTKKAREYIERGYMPSRSVKEKEAMHKRFLKELAKGFGYVEKAGGSYWEPNLNYDTDYVPQMPMLHQLIGKDSIPEPQRSDFDDTRVGFKKYQKAKEEWEKYKEENIKKNKEIHKNLLDRNWESVMEEFIRKSAHFNAIQDNKNQLYFGLKLLNDYKVYATDSSELNRISKNATSSKAYQKDKNDKLYRWYQNWLHRVIFDQYKEKPDSKKAHIMNVLQSITSMNYMTFNIRGGVANVTVGGTNILGEAFASEYFGKEWIESGAIYASGITGYFANMYSDISTNLADAIIKAFHIVDYDELIGVITSSEDFEEWSKRIRDLGFTPLSAGEHYMQNRALFAMMLSHRVIQNPKYGESGEPKYIIINFNEYTSMSADIVLKQTLNDEQYAKFEEYVKDIKDSPSELKDYLWFRKNIISDFVKRRLDKETQDKFAENLENYRKTKETEFEQAPNLYSQFKLGDDGRMQFKEDSLLAEMHALTQDQEVSDSYKALGKFKERVIAVNKKIHGHYGKLDAAQIESKWWGGLVMQYHKHLVPGFLKRYRKQGYYNETRGTIEKGSRIALWDFLTAPIDDIADRNNMTDGEKEALKGIQNVFSYITDYFHYLSLNAKFMDKSEKNNLLRNLGDAAGIVGGVLMALLLRLGWDDDDDSFVYNFGLYQADRLSSEAFMWNLYGAFNEGKKLWSNPVAVQSIINDVFSAMGTCAGMLMEGEDYDPYYHSGRFAGQHKLGVYIERRIPYWRNYIALRDIADNNHYYKLGDNMLGLIKVKDIANTLKGKKD